MWIRGCLLPWIGADETVHASCAWRMVTDWRAGCLTSMDDLVQRMIVTVGNAQVQKHVVCVGQPLYVASVVDDWSNEHQYHGEPFFHRIVQTRWRPWQDVQEVSIWTDDHDRIWMTFWQYKGGWCRNQRQTIARCTFQFV